jgi:hypothetical protein
MYVCISIKRQGKGYQNNRMKPHQAYRSHPTEANMETIENDVGNQLTTTDQ